MLQGGRVNERDAGLVAYPFIVFLSRVRVLSCFFLPLVASRAEGYCNFTHPKKGKGEGGRRIEGERERERERESRSISHLGPALREYRSEAESPTSQDQMVFQGSKKRTFRGLTPHVEEHLKGRGWHFVGLALS